MAYTNNPLLPKARRLAVNLVLVNKVPPKEVALKYAVHISTLYRWIKKGKNDRKSFIYSIPSIPKSHPNRISTEVCKQIINTRIISRNRCAEVIQFLLKKDGVNVSTATIKRVLRTNGLTRKTKRYIKDGTRFQRPLVNKPGDLVQVDTIHFIHNHGYRFFIYAGIDVFSRIAFAKYSKSIGTVQSTNFCKEIVSKFPFDIGVVQADNGGEFQDSFRASLNNMGIKLRHSRVRKPNDNAHIERFIRTIQEECFDSRTPNLNSIEKEIEEYLDYYNNSRPHLGIGCRFPQQLISHRS